ncbi:alkaline phosphatase D family protein [uncultured Tenacibaculum sp.]|uniref:alkaline phosphatase D family protein n=1 Tax=uncultured Tenacibaculum sp. TaxID=174713 RepID=UPI00262B441D|nr:alkaline phosphatase D family protein [uncultured Tenacibaculum sp.]
MNRTYNFSNRRLSILFLICLIFSVKAQENLLKLPDYIAPKDRIAFALYTIHENTLKLTAQFYPIKNVEPFEASLEVFQNNKWKKIAETRIIYPGYTAPFRVENWDDTKELKYRVNHNNTAYYEGILRKNPIDKEDFVMAAFTCNSIYPGHGGDISRNDIIENVKKIKPDLLFFSGDQVYDHSQHYLYWLKFGKDFEEIIRNTPTITIPDDHDIGQGNLWGQGGKKANSRRGISGGYYMPIEYIKEVERAQTSHLPDPYDATPIEQGIGVYYTDLKWGGMSFAILEDRKFKSGLDLVAEKNPDVFPKGSYEAIFNPNVDTKKMDVEGLVLLGERQLKFLEDWTTDWENASMKTVLSQTIFSQVNNYSGKHDRELLADFDTNAWPQTGRNKALSVIRKSFSVMVAGDQHLGSVVKHGVDDFGDAGYSFCTPAIANFWLRWWDPKTAGANQEKNAPKYTGDFLDGFQNKMTVKAVGNPTLPEIKEGGKLSTRAAGYGIVRYHKKTRNITFECWGRNVNVTDAKSKQYPGWPITIQQSDNYTIKNGYELPRLTISKPAQVVTIHNSETNELISSLRIKGSKYQAKVPKEGLYTITIGEGKNIRILQNIKAKKRNKIRKKVIID